MFCFDFEVKNSFNVIMDPSSLQRGIYKATKFRMPTTLQINAGEINHDTLLRDNVEDLMDTDPSITIDIEVDEIYEGVTNIHEETKSEAINADWAINSQVELAETNSQITSSELVARSQEGSMKRETFTMIHKIKRSRNTKNKPHTKSKEALSDDQTETVNNHPLTTIIAAPTMVEPLSKSSCVNASGRSERFFFFQLSAEMQEPSWYNQEPASGSGQRKRKLISEDAELEIIAPHVIGLTLSTLCCLKGEITPLINGRFQVKYYKFLRYKGYYTVRCTTLREALWVYEMMAVIDKRPRSFSELQQVGNYDTLAILSDEFHFFSDPLDYFIQLLRWTHYCLWQFTSNSKIDLPWPKDMNEAIEILSKMDLSEIQQCIVSDRSDVAPITTTNEDVGLKVIRKELLKVFANKQFCLKDMDISVQKLFQDHSPPLNLPALGLIHESKLKLESSNETIEEA